MRLDGGGRRIAPPLPRCGLTAVVVVNSGTTGTRLRQPCRAQLAYFEPCEVAPAPSNACYRSQDMGAIRLLNAGQVMPMVRSYRARQLVKRLTNSVQSQIAATLCMQMVASLIRYMPTHLTQR